MAETLDAGAVRHWCRVSLTALGHAREEIDALNVYPVPDGDTGTNLYLTMEAATDAAEATPADYELASALRAVVDAAMLGARGNSGVILSQLFRGFATGLGDSTELTGRSLASAMSAAADAGYTAVAVPVEGTILTVARQAALAADTAAQSVQGTGMAGLAFVAQAAARGAAEALARTPDQLEVLRRAGVVDAGGRGLCLILDSLVYAITDTTPVSYPAVRLPRLNPMPAPAPELAPTGPGYEVMFLLDAVDTAIPVLEKRLSALGDSLVVAGGDRLWNVHVHVDDPGAAIEAGVEAGRPHRIQITNLREAVARRAEPDATHAAHATHAGHAADAALATSAPVPAGTAAPARTVVAVAAGPGIATLFREHGARVVDGGPGRRPATADLLAGIAAAGTDEVVLLPNDGDARATAEAAAARARAGGRRVTVIPTRSCVQGLAALAVHEPSRGFDEDVVAMSTAASGTGYGELTVAMREAITSAGVCRPGQVLGLVEGEVVVISDELLEAGYQVLSRLLARGGELVTLVTGGQAPAELAGQLRQRLRAERPDLEFVVYAGGQDHYPLLIGVE
ncbi:MAG: DAK2 domain-containing protein [Sporichthyaceae bacterium]|nr:DAK2 domain-containing protein [Sporichthyaceae bacterium]